MAKTIGNVEIDSPCILAPMAGYTDRAFRELCTDFGAGMTVTEMVSVKALCYKDKKTKELMQLSDYKFPQAIQLFGNDPQDFSNAIESVLEFNPDIIDINMGCPVKKIVSQGSGCSLMKEPKLCYEIVKSVKEKTDKPVTVKIRKGYSDSLLNAVEVAKYCEDAGADAICVHGRTKEQMYSGAADWKVIEQVKKNVSIPVIGNGDIKCAEDATDMLEQTGCDFVMIGRGALGNPFIFREINTYINTDKLISKAQISEILFTMLKHTDKICKYKGERIGIREMRKHICHYIKGLKYSAYFRNKLSFVSTKEDLILFTKDILEKNT